MTPHLTRDQARRLDQLAMTRYAVPGVVLMENAGRAMAELLLTLGVRRPVVCCGKGNNGGDGLVIARHLDLATIPVRIVLFANPADVTGDAAVNLRVCQNLGLPIEVSPDAERFVQLLADADWVVDALFGSGLRGTVQPPFDRVIAAMITAAARRFAVDLPSGLDADTGEPLGVCVRADHTATVMAPKRGFACEAAKPWLGQVHVVSMGVPNRLLDEVT